jgi:glycosyltransferase involved in cell wall biosynthesis
MRWAFENREKAAAIGQQAAQDAVNHWTWERSARKINDLISRQI